MALSQEDVDRIVINVQAFNDWAEGGPADSATMANGRVVPSPSKALADGQTFKGPAIVWPPGGTISDALQVYTDGTLEYSPIPSFLPFSGSGAFPTATMRVLSGYIPKSTFDTLADIDLTTVTTTVILSATINGTIIEAGSRINAAFSCVYGNSGTDTVDPFAISIFMVPDHTSTPINNGFIVTEQQSNAGVFSAGAVGNFDAVNGVNTVEVIASVNWLGNPVGGRILTLLNPTLTMTVEVT